MEKFLYPLFYILGAYNKNKVKEVIDHLKGGERLKIMLELYPENMVQLRID